MCGRVPHIIFVSTYNSCSTCSGLCTASCVGSTIANSSLTCASNYCASGCSGVCDNKTCNLVVVYRVVSDTIIFHNNLLILCNKCILSHLFYKLILKILKKNMFSTLYQ